MSEKTEFDSQIIINARQIIEAAEKGDHQLFDSAVTEIGKINSNVIINEVGRLARRLHDSVKSGELGSRISALADSDIPDAKKRIDYIISITENAANSTLDEVEKIRNISDKYSDDIENVISEKINGMEEAVKILKESHNLYMSMSDESLNNILTAQGFQDISGQILRRIFTLIHEVEESLVRILTLSGVQRRVNDGEKKRNEDGPAVPGVSSSGDVLTNQDDVDDLLSGLGF